MKKLASFKFFQKYVKKDLRSILIAPSLLPLHYSILVGHLHSKEEEFSLSLSLSIPFYSWFSFPFPWMIQLVTFAPTQQPVGENSWWSWSRWLTLVGWSEQTPFPTVDYVIKLITQRDSSSQQDSSFFLSFIVLWVISVPRNQRGRIQKGIFLVCSLVQKACLSNEEG